jgi:diaminopimelate decarboxylase
MATMQDSKLNQIKPLSYSVDSDNKISIGNVKLEDLANTYGTPLYLMCEDTIRERARAYKRSFEKAGVEHLVIYASKAMNCMAICKLMEQEGLGLDVVSSGELYTALKAGFPTNKIIFHGNNKSAEEIQMCIENSVTIILDNYNDLRLIESYLKNNPNAKTEIIIRITPGIECHTHEYIKTGKIDSKFGFNLEDLDSLFTKLVKISAIKIRGLHAHIGSQIFETEPHKDTCRVLLEFYKKLQEKFQIQMPDLNVGGGLGIKYLESDDPPEIEAWVEIIITAVKKNCEELGIKLPRIMVEPGRSMVGSSGVTIYRVGNIKDIPGLRKYLAVDGGMADNSRPIMYQAKYTAELDGKVSDTKTEIVTIAGKYCESGDILIKDYKLAHAEVGDLLAIYSTGAYNYSMSSNYNRVTKPAVVLVKDGKSNPIVQRETLDDLIRNDLIPDYLI